jgi:hypothetical protein
MTQLVLILVLLGVLVAVSIWGAFYFARKVVPDLSELGTVVPGDPLTRYQFLTLKADHLKARNDARNGLFQATAGIAVIAALLGAWLQVQASQSQFAQQQLSGETQFRDQQDLARRGQLADRFRAAVDQIGRTDSLDARLGGIYVLESVARDAWDSMPRQNRIRLAVYDVLLAYIDRHAAWTRDQPAQAFKGFDEMRIYAPDVQAVLTVLGRRDQQADDPNLDMAYIAIPDATLFRADLRNANFIGDGLQDVDFIGAHLENAAFQDADFYYADLFGAHLENAKLLNADLSGARNLGDAYLKGATANANTKWPKGFDWQAAGVTVATT